MKTSYKFFFLSFFIPTSILFAGDSSSTRIGIELVKQNKNVDKTEPSDRSELSQLGFSKVASPNVTNTYIRQDFVFDDWFWQNIDVGIKDLAGAWWVDYNCLIRVSFIPNVGTTGYTLTLNINPYMVRRATGGSFHFSDGVNEYPDMGTAFLGSPIEVKTKGTLTDPSGGYWNLTETSHGNGDPIEWTLNGSKPYGQYTLILHMWNSSSQSYVSRTFTFSLENEDVINQSENGYLVASGLVLSRSENIIENSSRAAFDHYAGTFRYYISKKSPAKADIIEYRQRWQRVRNSSGYGSPYGYVPEYLLLMRMSALGKQNEWSGLPTSPTNYYAIVLSNINASTIINTGTASISTTTEWIISPKIYQSGTNTTFGVAGTFGYQYSGLSATVTVTGSSNNTYIILPNPRTVSFSSYPITVKATGVGKDDNLTPSFFSLHQNFPNPFNPSTSISFSLPSKSFVDLKVFDLVGGEVSTLVSEELSAGNYSQRWNAANLPSGVYLYRLQAGSFTQTKKLVLLK